MPAFFAALSFVVVCMLAVASLSDQPSSEALARSHSGPVDAFSQPATNSQPSPTSSPAHQEL